MQLALWHGTFICAVFMAHPPLAHMRARVRARLGSAPSLSSSRQSPRGCDSWGLPLPSSPSTALSLYAFSSRPGRRPFSISTAVRQGSMPSPTPPVPSKSPRLQNTLTMALSNIVTLADVQYLAARPLPTAPDGRYDEEVVPVSASATKKDPHSNLYNVVDNLGNTIKNAVPMLKNAVDQDAIAAIADAAINQDALDDRKKLFTTMLATLCRLPEGSDASKKLNDQVITLLYNTLPHPPCTYIGTDYPAAQAPTPSPALEKGAPGPRLSTTFRSADGSGNNVNMPNLGMARTAYARTVQNKYPLAPSTLPDTGDVFDSLLKAPDFQPHPGKNSSLTFAFASLVTHQLFRTDPRDMTKNNTSSYLDLSILYGTSQSEQDAVRDKESGKGLLYPDAFSEERLIFVPPASTALLVLFSRNHNYIAEMLLKLNERGKWTNPPPQDAAARARQDEEIFQTARLVNCGNFMAMIFGDYVAGFLGLGRDGCSWSMNPFDPIKTPEGDIVGRGDGNQCSVEFNVLYRWHATTAQEDIKWTEQIFKEAFKASGKPLEKLELSDFVPAVTQTWKKVDPNPRTRTFAGIERGPDGRFSDDDLAKILQDATEKVAGAYRARGSPSILRIVEILGMEQARQWGVCTMNEFRAYLGLKTFGSFEEWNSDPEIAATAQRLYGHIDNLELYPGLQAEEIMGLGPASGLCCGYTMTRAILSDAIALVRGDRFYTTDYTPSNLTAWGFQDCARDPNNGAFGAAIPRLLFRHLPRHYPADSVYGLFPFFIPEVTKENLKKLGIADGYDFKRPVAKPVAKPVETVKEIAAILKDHGRYSTIESSVFEKTASKFSVIDNLPEQRKVALTQALFPTQDALTTHKTWFRTTIQQLIKDHTYKLGGLPGSRVDLIGNVINLAPVYWVSEFILGIPLKTTHKKDGILTPQEVNDMLRLVFNAVYLNSQPENNWSISKRASYFAQIFTQFIEKALSDAAPGSFIIKTISSFLPHTHEPAHDFLGKMAESKTPHDTVVADILGFAVASAVTLAKSAAQVVDFYLDSSRAKERAEVIRLAGATDAKSLEQLRGYVREGQRLAPQFDAILREDAKAASSSQLKQSYVLNLKKALTNPADFSDPLTVNPGRKPEVYAVMQDASFYKCLGTVQGEEILVEMVKTVFQLPNLGRVNGRTGTMNRVTVEKYGVETDQFINHIGLPSYWPSSMSVTYGA